LNFIFCLHLELETIGLLNKSSYSLSLSLTGEKKAFVETTEKNHGQSAGD
jgi:hypothetical protein